MDTTITKPLPKYNHGKRAFAGGLIMIGAVLAVTFYILFAIGNRDMKEINTQANYQILSGFNYTTDGAQQFIDLCLERSATYNLMLYGRRGGVIELTNPFVANAKTSILLDDVKAIPPSRDAAQKTLADAINTGMRQCIAEMQLFKNRGFTITTSGEPSTRVSVTDRTVEIHYTYPFTISKGKKQKNYQNFAITIPVRLGNMIEAAAKIINFAKDRPEDADLTNLLDTNLEVIFFTMDKANVVVLRDLDNSVDGAPYEFWFGKSFNDRLRRS